MDEIGPLDPRNTDLCIKEKTRCKNDYRTRPLIVVSQHPGINWETQFLSEIQREAALLTSQWQFLSGYRYEIPSFLRHFKKSFPSSDSL